MSPDAGYDRGAGGPTADQHSSDEQPVILRGLRRVRITSKRGGSMFMHTSGRRRMALVLSAAALTFSAAACGGDDDEGATATSAAGAPTTAAGAPTTGAAPTTGEATETTDAATDTSGATEGTAGGEASAEAFCEAELEAEAAAQSEDPSQAGPAFEALVAAAPEDIRETVEAVIAAAEQGPGSPDFDEPYGEMIQYMRENCGFNEIDVVATDYSFTGLPTELEAGPAIVSMDNTGEEFHEISFYRVNDDVTESLEDLLALPEEEALTKVTRKGGTFGPPGATALGTANLDEPGRYIAICEIPQGLTPEVMAELEGSEDTAPEGTATEGTAPEGTATEGTSPLGPPHFVLGMVQELTVT